MEPESNPATVAHRPPPLNSDQLNYLIWRYLQESGYGEAAVKLQRDWKVDAENLPFARHIKGQALVSLVQKGLRYHHLSLTVDENGQQTKPLIPSMFFFGPEGSHADLLSAPKEPLIKQADIDRAPSPASTIAPTSRKQTREPGQNGTGELTPQPVKRGRKPAQNLAAERNGGAGRKPSGSAMTEPDVPNGHIIPGRDTTSPSAEHAIDDNNALSNGMIGDEKMEVDAETSITAGMVDTVMEESVEEPLPPLVPTLTNGESRAVQVQPAKVANLAPTSAVLSLTEGRHVTKVFWRPADLSLLAAQGEDFCGVWKLDGLDLQPESVKPLPRNLFQSSDSILITAAAWESSGSFLAVATYSDQEGQIHLFDGHELSLLESLPASQRALTSLKWLPGSLRLVGIAASDEQNAEQTPSSTILLWDLSPQSLGASAPLSLTIPSSLLDLDCVSNGNTGIICATGESSVYYCKAESELLLEGKWSSPTSNDAWTFVRCVWRGELHSMLVAASAEGAHIWLPARGIMKERVHDTAITGIDVRSRSYHTTDTAAFEFATSSMDGTVKVWHHDPTTNIIECIQRLAIGSSNPIMSLSYSPDGFCLAAASYGVAQIWNAEHGYNLMATWEGIDPDWTGASLKDDDLKSAGGMSSVNGDGGPASADHTLAWHNDSKKLAFGLGSQVAVINFQR